MRMEKKLKVKSYSSNGGEKWWSLPMGSESQVFDPRSLGPSWPYTPRDPGSPKLRMVSWNHAETKNTLRFVSVMNDTPKTHPLTFGDWMPRVDLFHIPKIPKLNIFLKKSAL